MNHRAYSASVLVVIGLVLLGCDVTPTSGPLPTLDEGSADLSLAAVDPTSIDGEFLALGNDIPGFGGMYYQPSGELVVQLTDLSQQTKSRGAIDKFLLRRERQALRSPPRFHRVKYSFRQLKTWQQQSNPIVGVVGVVYTDVDETANRLRIGVKSLAAKAAVSAELVKLRIPAAAFEVSLTEPPVPAYSLNDVVRPTLGGLRIVAQHTSKGCTLGFHVRTASATPSFLTNSHCTDVQGGTENTRFHQPSVGKLGTTVGTESGDPGYSTGGSCPAGRKCRFSDAAIATNQAALTWRFEVARTTVEGTSSPGSTVVAARLPVVADQGAPLAGSLVRKTGFASGSTRGTVAGTCLTTTVDSPSNVTLFCQYTANAASRFGDSGSPVYTWSGVAGTGVTIVGLLWGITSTQFFFSPMDGIERELGQLTTH